MPETVRHWNTADGGFGARGLLAFVDRPFNEVTRFFYGGH